MNITVGNYYYYGYKLSIVDVSGLYLSVRFGDEMIVHKRKIKNNSIRGKNEVMTYDLTELEKIDYCQNCNIELFDYINNHSKKGNKYHWCLPCFEVWKEKQKPQGFLFINDLE